MSTASFEARLAALLPDDYSPSKDWQQSTGLARVEVLRELHQASRADRDLGWDAATAASEMVMQLSAELRRVYGLNALNAEKLQKDNDELARLLNVSRAHASSLGSVIRIAEALVDDPAYELSGTDFDYEHTVHDKIEQLQEALIQSRERELRLSTEVAELRGRLDYAAA